MIDDKNAGSFMQIIISYSPMTKYDISYFFVQDKMSIFKKIQKLGNVQRRDSIAFFLSSAKKTKLPLTTTSAPTCLTSFATLSFMPPSTSIL